MDAIKPVTSSCTVNLYIVPGRTIDVPFSGLKRVSVHGVALTYKSTCQDLGSSVQDGLSMPNLDGIRNEELLDMQGMHIVSSLYVRCLCIFSIFYYIIIIK